MTRRRAALLAVLAALALGTTACAGDPPASSSELPDSVGDVADDPTVRVADNLFEPQELTVEAGTEVTWVWEGRVAHDVVGDGFESDLMVEGTFTATFDEVGTHPYVCTLHPAMQGSVLVVPAED